MRCNGCGFEMKENGAAYGHAPDMKIKLTRGRPPKGTYFGGIYCQPTCSVNKPCYGKPPLAT